jgi:formamidopyrimidine-DNA glycosylase
MPELPEVETVARELRRFLPGRRIRRVLCHFPGVVGTGARTFQAALSGRTFTSVIRHGKYLFLGLSQGREVALHLRMTGQLLLWPRGKLPDAHCHLEIFLVGSDRKLVFRDVRKFGRLELLPGGASEFIRTKRLGPDALAIRPGELYESLHRTGRCLKAALLDQRVLAGLGNIYTDEVLFRERLSPRRLGNSLSRHRVQSLSGAIREVLRSAIRRRGTSISDYVDPGGRRGGFQFVLRVYGRKGEPCSRCGTAIVRGKVAGRGTWTCPRCQPDP